MWINKRLVSAGEEMARNPFRNSHGADNQMSQSGVTVGDLSPPRVTLLLLSFYLPRAPSLDAQMHFPATVNLS